MSEKVSQVVCVTGAMLLQGSQKMTIMFRGVCSTLDVSMFILRGRCSTLDVFLRIALSGLRQVVTNVQIVWQASDIARVSFCMTGVVFGDDPLRLECYFVCRRSFRTSHFTLYILHCTLTFYTLH